MKNIFAKTSKFTAVFTAVCFTLSIFGSSVCAAAVPQVNIYNNIFDTGRSVINADAGKITSVYDAGSSKTVINIQDLHSHYLTQKNIAEIIKNIDSKYKLKFIFAEGGYGNIDTSWTDALLNSSLKSAVVDELMKEGELTGSEYYVITNNRHGILKGIDNRKEHQENIKRLNSIIEKQDLYEGIIKRTEKEINVLSRQYVCARNKKFGKKTEEHENGVMPSERYYRILAKYVKDINAFPDRYNNITKIKIEDYPNICRFISMKNTGGRINLKKVTAELADVVNEIKTKVPYAVYRELLKNTDNFKDTQKTAELIEIICDKADINIKSRYHDLAGFLKINRTNMSFNPVDLINEEKALAEQIRLALSYTGEEYEVTYLSDFFKYLKSYLTYSLISEDWKYFKNGFSKFRKLYLKYASADRLKEIENDFAEINKYYEINNYRNDIFVGNVLSGFDMTDMNVSGNNTENPRSFEDILRQSDEIIIVVTGGFHSSDLKQIFGSKNINTFVITPNIKSSAEYAKNKYREIIAEQSKLISSQALAYTIASCSSDLKQKQLLVNAAAVCLGTADTEQLKSVFGENFDFPFAGYKPQADEDKEKISLIAKSFENAVYVLPDMLFKKGLQEIFYPDIDSVMISLSAALYDAGIYFSKGEIFEIQNSGYNGTDLCGVIPEVYSRMAESLQYALLKKQTESDIDSELSGNNAGLQLSVGGIIKKIGSVFRKSVSSGEQDQQNEEIIKTLLKRGFSKKEAEQLIDFSIDFARELDWTLATLSVSKRKITPGQIMNFVALMNKYGLKYVDEQKDTRINMLMDYCFNGLDVSEDEFQMLMELAENLMERNIFNIATENNYLALKIFINKKFNEMIDEKISENRENEYFKSTGMRYDIALDIARRIARINASDEKNHTDEFDFDFYNIDLITELLLKEQFADIETAKQTDILDENTEILTFHADTAKDDVVSEIKDYLVDGLRFEPSTFDKFLAMMGLTDNNVTHIQRHYNESAKRDFLDRISDFTAGRKIYIHFNGHGEKNDLISKKGENGIDVETISAEELAQALIEAYKRGVNLKDITIDLNSCFSYGFALNLYKILSEYTDELPLVCAAAGYETMFGITTETELGTVAANSFASLIKYMKNNGRNKLTLFDVIRANAEGVNANATVFMSDGIDYILQRAETDRKVKELMYDRRNIRKPVYKKGARFTKRPGMGELLSMINNSYDDFNKMPVLPSSVKEMSVTAPLKNKNKILFYLDKYAHVWEEIFFRAIPAALTIISPAAGIAGFMIMQPLFVFSHTIVRWIVQKDSSGIRKNFRNMVYEDFRNLGVPSAEVGIPYLIGINISLLFPGLSVFAVILSAAVSSVIHKKHNDKFPDRKLAIAGPEAGNESGDYNERIKELFESQKSKLEYSGLSETVQNMLAESVNENDSRGYEEKIRDLLEDWRLSLKYTDLSEEAQNMIFEAVSRSINYDKPSPELPFFDMNTLLKVHSNNKNFFKQTSWSENDQKSFVKWYMKQLRKTGIKKIEFIKEKEKKDFEIRLKMVHDYAVNVFEEFFAKMSLDLSFKAEDLQEKEKSKSVNISEFFKYLTADGRTYNGIEDYLVSVMKSGKNSIAGDIYGFYKYLGLTYSEGKFLNVSMMLNGLFSWLDYIEGTSELPYSLKIFALQKVQGKFTDMRFGNKLQYSVDLDTEVFADTLKESGFSLIFINHSTFFEKYENNLRIKTINEIKNGALKEKGYEIDETFASEGILWIKVPQISETDSFEEIKQKIGVVNILSSETWCIKLKEDAIVSEHLKDGDIYFYMEQKEDDFRQKIYYEPKTGISTRSGRLTDISDIANVVIELPSDYMPQIIKKFGIDFDIDQNFPVIKKVKLICYRGLEKIRRFISEAENYDADTRLKQSEALFDSFTEELKKMIGTPDVNNAMAKKINGYIEILQTYKNNMREHKNDLTEYLSSFLEQNKYNDVQNRFSILASLKNKNKFVFYLDKYAHVWEEIVFRGIPAAVTLLNPVIGIPLFLVMQPLFVFSHTIVKWLVQKDSAEVKKTVKELFKEDLKGKSVIAALMTVPYLIALTIPLFGPVVSAMSVKVIPLAVSTATVQVAHYGYNKSQYDITDTQSFDFYSEIRNIYEEVDKLRIRLMLANPYESEKMEIKSDEVFIENFTPRRKQAMEIAGQIEEQMKENPYGLETEIKDISQKVEDNIDNLNKFSFLLSDMYMILLKIKVFDIKADNIYKKQLLKKLEKKYMSLLENEFCSALTDIYEDETTRKHVRNVYKYSNKLLKYSGKNKDNFNLQFRLIISAALHDIGKNIIPSEITNKPSKLSDAEYEIMKLHVLFCGLITEGSIFKYFDLAAKYHHNNKGYNYNTEMKKILSRSDEELEEITDEELQMQQEAADIVNITDVYEALTAKRQYKDSFSPEIAFEKITGYTPEKVMDAGTEFIDKTEYGKEAMEYFVAWFFDEIYDGKNMFKPAIDESFALYNVINFDFVRIYAEKLLSVPGKLRNMFINFTEPLKNIFSAEGETVQVVTDYRTVKYSEIQNAVNDINTVTSGDKNSVLHVSVIVVDDIAKLEGEKLENTGLKVNGNSIYKIKNKDVIITGALNRGALDIAKALKNSSVFEREIKNILKHRGISAGKTDIQTVVAYAQADDIVIEDNIVVIPDNIAGSADTYKYISGALDVKTAMSVTYSKKTVISLENIDGYDTFEEMLKEGKARKVISVQQYEYLKSANRNSMQKIFSELRQNGIEVYVNDSEEIKDEYKQSGLTGQLRGSAIYDYYTDESSEIEVISDALSLMELENKIVNSEKPVLINITTLQNIFKTEKDITRIFDGLNAVLGNIKLKTGIGTITAKDIYAVAYNINMQDLPLLKDLQQVKAGMSDEEFVSVLNIDMTCGAGLILGNKSLTEENRHIFITALKERVLAKKALTDSYKEFGLKDKKLEMLLGRMLVLQLSNTDKKTVSIDNFSGNQDEIINEIMRLTQKAYNNDTVAVNSVIELILAYGEEYKSRHITKNIDANDARSYRAMLSAA